MAAWRDASILAGKKWDKVLGPVWEEAQGHIARELNLPDSRTVVFASNAHDLLIRIFSSLPAMPVRILSSHHEFLSAMRQFRRWEETGAATVTLVDEADLVEAVMTGRFDLIYISQIFYDSGRESDWCRLASYAHPEGPWVVVDGYHGFMAVPTDLSEFADRIFYIAGGYKYAMAGEGVGILHAPPGFASRPEITGWYAQANQVAAASGDSVWFAQDARRFLGSTFDPTGLYRFNAVQHMLQAQSLTTASIAKHVWALQTSFLDRARIPGLGLANSAINEPGARFLAFRGSRAAEVGQLFKHRGIDVDVRGELLRIGFSIYHDIDDVERLIEAVLG